MTHEHHQMHTSLDFGFLDMWDPLQIVISLAMIFVYIKWLKQDGFESVATYQKALFFSGVIIYLVAAGGPINFYGHHFLLSAHMLQQSLLYYVVPPLLIFGTPKYVFQQWMTMKWGKKFLETHLVISVLAFDILFSFYHIPMIFNVVMSNYVIMVTTHLILFLFSIQMWWPIISPLPEIDQTSELKKMAYIILGAVLITPACALIIFADTQVYAPYIGVPQIFELLSPLDDQQFGGILMKLIQELSFGSILAYLFYRWYKKENRVDSIDLHQPALVHHGNESKD